VISEASARAMQTVAAENPAGSGQGYGLGWMIAPALGRPTARHDGGMPGVATVTRLYPGDNCGTVVLTNTSNSAVVVEVTTRLGRILLNRPAPPPPATPPSPRPVPPPPPPPAPDVLAAFTGTWQGTLVHYQGDIPIRLVVSQSGEIDVSFAGRPAQKLVNPTLRVNSLRGQVDAILATTAGYRGIPTLQFRLERIGDRLTGLCTVQTANVVTIPHWVSLERQPVADSASAPQAAPPRPDPAPAPPHGGRLPK
jgi:hypothetical protein